MSFPAGAERWVMREADDPGDRRTLLVRAVMDARRAGEPVTLRADGSKSSSARRTSSDERGESDGIAVEYADRRLRFAVDDDGRAALEALLDDYPVFKVKQPETRKADEGVVHVSAIADPKHVADFLEAAFRRVYGLPEGYRLRASE